MQQAKHEHKHYHKNLYANISNEDIIIKKVQILQIPQNNSCY